MVVVGGWRVPFGEVFAEQFQICLDSICVTEKVIHRQQYNAVTDQCTQI